MDPCGAGVPQTSNPPKTEKCSSSFSGELVIETGDIGIHTVTKKAMWETS